VKHRKLKLSLLGVSLFLLLGGPTPGSVGNCTTAEQYADSVEHCQQKEAWTCARRRARGDLASDAEEMACISRITTTCSGAAWPPGCQPTQQESDACIQAMSDGSTLGGRGECYPDSLSCGEPPIVQPGCAACDQPAECNLCSGRSALTSGEDDDAGAGE